MARLSNRAVRFARRGLRALAWLPLRVLGGEDRARVLDRLTASAVTQVDIGGASLRFLTPSALLRSRALSLRLKEPDTLQWIDGFGADEVFWDVGANVGVFGLYAAKRRGVRVLAFEPSASNYMVLCRNIRLNALEERVAAYCAAFAGLTRLGVLNMGDEAPGGAVSQFGDAGAVSRYLPPGVAAVGQGTIGYAIDDFIRAFDPPFPNHLKIDVDGIEGPILQGAPATLRDPRLRSIMAELSLTDAAESKRAQALLAGAGFTLSHTGERQESGEQAAANHFFVRR